MPKPRPSSPTSRDALALSMVQFACNLAMTIRFDGPNAAAREVRKLSAAQARILPVVMAAMIPIDQNVNDLLAWVTTPGSATNGTPAEVRKPRQHPARVRRRIPLQRPTRPAPEDERPATVHVLPRLALVPPPAAAPGELDELETSLRVVEAERYRPAPPEADPLDADLRRVIGLLADMLMNPGPTDAELEAGVA